MSGRPEGEPTSEVGSTSEASLWSRPARRVYDASFGKIRRDLAILRSDLRSLIEGFEARQTAFNAELNQRFVEIVARVDQLDKDVRIIAAGRMELEAVTRRLATLEDHLIKDQPVDLSGAAESSDESSS